MLPEKQESIGDQLLIGRFFTGQLFASTLQLDDFVEWPTEFPFARPMLDFSFPIHSQLTTNARERNTFAIFLAPFSKSTNLGGKFQVKQGESPSMHVIPFKKQSRKLPEWEVIEMQGRLILKSPDSSDRFDGNSLGDVTLSPKDQANEQGVDLEIGKQLVEGKRSKMKKPLVVAQKVMVNDQVQYRLVAVLRDKTLFRNRPTPLSPSKQQPVVAATPPLAQVTTPLLVQVAEPAAVASNGRSSSVQQAEKVNPFAYLKKRQS